MQHVLGHQRNSQHWDVACLRIGESSVMSIDNNTSIPIRWVKISGSDLSPGDVISIGRSFGQNGEEISWKRYCQQGHPHRYPQQADLLRRSCQLKYKRDKSYALFGGTTILQHTSDKSFPMKTPEALMVAA